VGKVRRVGTLYPPRRGPRALFTFEYHDAWLDDPNRFPLEPALRLDRGAFTPNDRLFGSIGIPHPMRGWAAELRGLGGIHNSA
jgi:serine/threonine-protein kinase HipA